jgi:hypothetical protein
VPTPYNPGQYQGREYALEKYDSVQEMRWQAYNRAYFAVAESQAHTLHHTPGKTIDMYAFRAWQSKFIASSMSESVARGKGLTQGISKDDYPSNVWFWLYERMLVAEKLKKAK